MSTENRSSSRRTSAKKKTSPRSAPTSTKAAKSPQQKRFAKSAAQRGKANAGPPMPMGDTRLQSADYEQILRLPEAVALRMVVALIGTNVKKDPEIGKAFEAIIRAAGESYSPVIGLVKACLSSKDQTRELIEEDFAGAAMKEAWLKDRAQRTIAAYTLGEVRRASVRHAEATIQKFAWGEPEVTR